MGKSKNLQEEKNNNKIIKLSIVIKVNQRKNKKKE